MKRTLLVSILIIFCTFSFAINLQNVSVEDLGKWINAKQQGSYYATHNSLLRDDLGKIHLTYCSSGETFNQNFAPDWRETATYSTDRIRYQYSDNNGSSWSTATSIINAITENQFWYYQKDWRVQRNWANDGYYWEFRTDYNAWVGFQKNPNSNIGTGWGVIMRTQENLWQGACSNVLIYYKGKYYSYFESYTPPSGVLSIYVARANLPQGPYEIWTYDGWKTSPTSSTWRPVITPNIISIAGDDYVAQRYKEPGQGNPYNLLYGTGLPRAATQKDGKIYLYYIDTTYFFLWKDAQGNIHETGRDINAQIPYNLVAIGEDPTMLDNNFSNRMVDQSGTDLWDFFSPRYFPKANNFFNFQLKEINNEKKIVYRTSNNGIFWSNEQVLSTAPIEGTIADQNPDSGNTIIEISKQLIPLSNKNGQSKLSDLYLTYTKEHTLTNAPIGWKDRQDFNWYYGGTDIYGLKVRFQINNNPVCLENPDSIISSNEINSLRLDWVSSKISLSELIKSVKIYRYCS
jgi:hypothetical protein